MNVAIERYFIHIIHSDTRIFNLNFSFVISSSHSSRYRVVHDVSGEIIKDGFTSMDDALDFVRYHEYMLSDD
jgi:hypothetical protein